MLRAVITLALLITGCASLPENSTQGLAAEIFDPNGSIRAVDARADFRRVYCSINQSRGASLPDYRSCDETFRRVPPEPDATMAEVLRNPAVPRFTVLIAPGMGHDCFANLIGDFKSLRNAAESLGHSIELIPIASLGSTSDNAAIIRDAVAATAIQPDHGRLLLLGYSKGSNDVLMALTLYPEIAQNVSAVVGVSSAVGGSYIARDVDLWAVKLLTHVPGAECAPPSDEILDDLDPDVRKDWLATNELPSSVRYFSIITLPDTDHISTVLKSAYRDLAEIDARNDGQVIARDQVIPGSQVLAFVNADHWAIALPISRTQPLAGSTMINHNDYPREVLLQAILEYVGLELSRE
jgi:hypothetical protein